MNASSLHVTLFTDSEVFAGTERHIIELARALKDQDVRVSVACPSTSPLNRFAKVSNLEIIQIEKRGLLDVAAILKLREMLAAGQIDLIHAHNGRTALVATVARRLAGKGSVVATQHFIDPAHTGRSGLGARISSSAHRWVQRQTDQYIAISDAVEKAMIGRENHVVGKIGVIPNGISAPESFALTRASEVRKAFNIPADTLLVVCAARLAQEKDVHVLVEAMGAVTAQISSAQCIIAGDGPERGAIEEQVRRAPWGRKITLAGFREDVISIIHAADLFVLPSRAEPFGLVLLEAMSLSRPVVAVAAGGPLEIVENNETGLLVLPRDSASLAEAIISLLRNPEQRAAMGAKARLRFDRKFTAQAMACATKIVYEKAMQNSRDAMPVMAEAKCESC